MADTTKFWLIQHNLFFQWFWEGKMAQSHVIGSRLFKAGAAISHHQIYHNQNCSCDSSQPWLALQTRSRDRHARVILSTLSTPRLSTRPQPQPPARRGPRHCSTFHLFIHLRPPYLCRLTDQQHPVLFRRARVQHPVGANNMTSLPLLLVQ